VREHPKLIGDRSTAKVLARLVEVYGDVFLPFGENQRYDLIVDTGDNLLRVQCKTGRLHNGAIRFPACSSTYHHPNAASKPFKSHHYRGQADVFGVYCPETDEVYIVPVDEIGVRTGSLRVAAPLNSQRRLIRWADEYVLRGPEKARREERSMNETLFEAPAMYSV
jgi:hypothetical protein